MKNIILVLLSLMVFNCSFHKKKDITIEVTYPRKEYALRIYDEKQNLPKEKYLCLWGDTVKMELHPNGKIYRFKSYLKDGYYIAFFDREHKDTAMTAIIKKGVLTGLVKRWYEGKLEEVCEYKNGRMNGWRIIYFYSESGEKYTNIYKCKNNICFSIHEEW